MFERKAFSITNYTFKAASDDGPGTFEGYGSTWTLDDGGDVIIKGAFADALPAFRERGFVPVGHDWLGLPIATISEAKEDDTGLFFKAEFHTTSAAQDARTVMSERLARGKFVGLSIGFLPQLDDEGVEYREDGVRVIKKIVELAEISFVTVPMNRLAGATNAKSMTFTDESDAVLAAVAGFTDRAIALAALRTKAGRVLSQANRSRLTEISEGLRGASGQLDSILTETDPEQEDGKAREEFGRLRLLRQTDLMLIEGAAD